MTSNTKTIAELAHAIWEARGKSNGAADADWFEAERQLATSAEAATLPGEASLEESLLETFPASDPPATHFADVPPSNAEDRWDAAARSIKSNTPESSS